MNSPGRPASPEVVELYKPTCCLIDGGQRCNSPATSATFNKRLYKPALQKKQQVFPDPEVG